MAVPIIGLIRRLIKGACLIVAHEAKREIEAFYADSLFLGCLSDVVSNRDGPVLSRAQAHKSRRGKEMRSHRREVVGPIPFSRRSEVSL